VSRQGVPRWSVTGIRCCVAAAGPDEPSTGTCSTRSTNGRRYDQSCTSLTRSCKLLQCCEPPAEERGAVAPHATFCGRRTRATTSGDSVGRETERASPEDSHRPRLYSESLSGTSICIVFSLRMLAYETKPVSGVALQASARPRICNVYSEGGSSTTESEGRS
jgi:hypothetical protein